VTDVETAFQEVAARYDRCCWLDGGGARDWSGRRSLLGWLTPEDVSLTFDAGAGQVTRHAGGRAEVVGSDIFEVLEQEIGAGGVEDQWFGYAARPDLAARPASCGMPDAVWMRPSQVRFFTHDEAPSRLPAPAPDGVAMPPEYPAGFAAVQEELRAGNSYEVNLTYRLAIAADADPVATYLRLRALNPAPYAGFLQHDLPGHRAHLLSSSPERYALIGADRSIETKPIKGTTPRAADPVVDAELAARLAADPKYRAENLMIVDLLRNDLSMVCRPGTVEVPALMEVESYESVHQLVSTVRGRLADGVSTVAALRSLFPAGSMTGAPKRRTMEIIDAVEATPRGAYAGAFGWIAGDGRADLGVVIRSLMTSGDGTWRLGTGGGITVGSDVQEEWAETRWKAARLLAALR
jgi:para-aminobenzoate synthetase